MKSLAQVYNDGLVINAQPADRKSQAISEIEKQFNRLFIDLKPVFPAITTVVKTQNDLDTFKKQWLLSFAENGITSLKQFEMGMVIARKKNIPFVPSPGQFVTWCKQGMAQELGLPTVEKVMSEFRRYSAERFDYPNAESFPWSLPIVYWIITDLRKHMMQYNQSEVEVTKRAEYLLGKWATRLSKGGTVPEIKIQIEDKSPPKTIASEIMGSDEKFIAMGQDFLNKIRQKGSANV